MTDRSRKLCAELDALTGQTDKAMAFMRDMIGGIIERLDEPEVARAVKSAIAATEPAVRELVTVQLCATYSEEEISAMVVFQQSPLAVRMRESEPVLALAIAEGLTAIITPAIDRVLETL